MPFKRVPKKATRRNEFTRQLFAAPFVRPLCPLTGRCRMDILLFLSPLVWDTVLCVDVVARGRASRVMTRTVRR